MGLQHGSAILSRRVAVALAGGLAAIACTCIGPVAGLFATPTPEPTPTPEAVFLTEDQLDEIARAGCLGSDNPEFDLSDESDAPGVVASHTVGTDELAYALSGDLTFVPTLCQVNVFDSDESARLYVDDFGAEPLDTSIWDGLEDFDFSADIIVYSADNDFAFIAFQRRNVSAVIMTIANQRGAIDDVVALVIAGEGMHDTMREYVP